MKMRDILVLLLFTFPLTLCSQSRTNFKELNDYINYSNNVSPKDIDKYKRNEYENGYLVGMKAYFLIENGNSKKAKSLLKKEVFKTENLIESTYIKLALAKIHLAEKDTSKYEDLIIEALEEDKNNKWLYLELFDNYKNKDSLLAISYLEKSLALDTTFSHALIEKAYQFDFNIECDKVIALLKPSIENSSEIVSHISYLADAYFYCGDVENAEKLY